MTLRWSEKEQTALKKRATREGISMQEAARRAIRELSHGLITETESPKLPS